MAKRKFLVVAGQSNATAIGDAPTWEDEHPTIALRSPLVTLGRAPQFSEAAPYAELWTMPATFAGGQQTGWLGDGTPASSWQSFDIRGKVVPAVRFLTFYNPTPSYLNLGSGQTVTYPGQGTILAAASGNVLTTSVVWQYNNAGLVLTRLRTGTTHTIQAGWSAPTTVVTVSPPMIPPPEPGEVFSYVPTGGASSTTSEVKLVQRFGGLNDIGTLLDGPPIAAADAPGYHFCEVRKIAKVSGFGPARASCRSRFPFVGQPVIFGVGIIGFVIVTATNTGTETLTMSAPIPVDTVLVFPSLGAGTAPGGITFDSVRYYVVYSVGNDIRVSLTQGGTPVDLTSAHVGLVYVTYALPSGITSGAIYYVTRVGKEDETQSISAFAAGTITASALEHGLMENERIRFAGTPLPPELTAGVDYYVKVTAFNTFSVSATRGGPAIVTSAATGGATFVRQEGSFHFFFSATPGGAEVVLNDTAGNGDATETGTRVQFSQQFRGSLTGMTLRALTGPNAGQSVPLGDIYFDVVNGTSVVKLGSPFVSAPTTGDTYTIEPPKVNGKDVPFHKWAYFLPWCPFEGGAKYHGPFGSAASLAETVGAEIFLELPDAWPQEQVRIAGRAPLTPKLNYGSRYYTEKSNGAQVFLSLTYGGGPIFGTSVVAPPVNASSILLRQEGKTNPYPPGFNYPNHNIVVSGYQPFDGPGLMNAPRMGFAAGLAVSLAEYYGEPINVVQLAVGGTNIGHTDVMPAAYNLSASNWFDVKQLLSWAPTDLNSIFARFLDTLDAAKLAFEAVGDEGECIGIVWVQGEGDASFEELANRYEVNARRLKTAMRQAIKDRGMFSRPTEELRWIDPHCQTTPDAWPFAAIVNAAKDALIAEDPYSATFEQQDLERLSDLNGPTDSVHYSGAGMTELERRAYAAILSIGEGSTEVEIANLALSLIGEPAKVFSLDPAVDQSAQAAECAKFLPIARDTILETYAWSFATKLVNLTETTKDAIRSDWTFAYLLPPDLLSPLEVLPQGSSTDVAAPTELVPAWRAPMASVHPARNGYPYAIEKDAIGRSVLYTNVANARLRYNQRVTAATVVPVKFKLAVARKLAALIAGQFLKGEAGAALAQRLDMGAKMEAGDAAATDANRRQNRPFWPQQGAWDRS
jgi:hypothetical protein